MNLRGPAPRIVMAATLAAAAVCLTLSANASVVRRALDDGVYAQLRHGRSLFLECRFRSEADARRILSRYLAHPETWTAYRQTRAAAVPFRVLTPEAQREALLAIFEDAYVDEEGWHHVVNFAEGENQETLWSLAEWLTGEGWNAETLKEANDLQGERLRAGDRILIPRDMLREIMRKPTPDRTPPPEPEPEPEPSAGADAELDRLTPPDPDQFDEMVIGDLSYNDEYATYRLREGEALYTAVVVRFTDYRENKDILEACDLIQELSGIPDVHDMKPGQQIRIPIEMLSNRYRPAGSPERQQYEATIEEARRLRGQVRSQDLEGVVVILDPGHGGRDQGAVNRDFGLYEDQINYDIASRIKQILLNETAATVHMTVYCPRLGYEPRDVTRFQHKTTEVLLTNPRYANHDARVSSNLRWALVNSIYRREVARGVDPRKIVFTSVHTDALFNKSLRGAMVYIPGAHLRRDRESLTSSVYQQFQEVREQNYATSTAAERRRDEALSRNFAVALLDALGRKSIKRHDVGDPIRNQIRQDGGRVYVPAVLRNVMVPTKVLIESANLTNSTDCERLADPQWRQRFAEAYVDALKTFYGSGG